ncbi:carboxypeptidase-like protein [Ancylomarina subtilis]|uniref:Carboxypeptidase-like protein n=1 Tax=Ancylomarina subtilis TaxID=1639035 RepID=A0A4Q7V8C5_9BACT|nr:carboxypeptidase-like regulatory domain-containing protein [Ancylomarina subtilis]RZT91740.1 carboxypeptidase-like protein [Ancylomarina subtilis]
MKTNDKKWMSSISEISRVLDEEAHIYETDEATKSLTHIFSGYKIQLSTLAYKMDQPTEWLTRDKNEIKVSLLNLIYPLSVAFIRLANSTGDELLLDQVKISKGKLSSLNETDLHIYADKLIGLSKARKAELVVFGISEEMITACETELNSFEQKRIERLMLVDDKKVAGVEFNKLKTKMKYLLKQELDWSIESYRNTQPDFVNHYFTARQVPAAIHRHYDVLGYITDEVSGKPISLGQVSVEGQDLSVKITANGTFRFKSFPEGEFRLKIENMGYNTLFVSVRRYASEHRKLHLKMMPKPLVAFAK